VKDYTQMPVIDGTSDRHGVRTWSSVASGLDRKAADIEGAIMTDSISVAEVHHTNACTYSPSPPTGICWSGRTTGRIAGSLPPPERTGGPHVI
jgi:hypothetical protein